MEDVGTVGSERWGHAAELTMGGLTPVSTAMSCVVVLAAQYFLLYTAVAVFRTGTDLLQLQWHRTLDVLVAATSTVNMAPMLAVLFLAVRLRAFYLTRGNPEAYDLPQPFVKYGMHCATWGLVVQMAVVLLLPSALERERKEEPTLFAKTLGLVRWLAVLAVYGGLATVGGGAIAMPAPEAIWDGARPAVAPAVACTLFLCIQYFSVYLAVALVETYEQFVESNYATTKLAAVLQLAQNTVNFAPMLAVLFLGARMRALQLDPDGGGVQPWAQTCFYVCTFAVLGQTVLVVLAPLLLAARVEIGEVEGDATFEVDGQVFFWVLNALRYACMVALYGGTGAVLYSVVRLEALSGPTPDVSPAMQCVMNLTVQFFAVYLLIWVLWTLRQCRIRALEGFLDVALPTMEAARRTVQFCPMLAVMFLGLRLRALQLTGGEGAPQRWAQAAMVLATFAVLAQVVLVLVAGLFTRSAPETDEDGNVVAKVPVTSALGVAATVLRYLLLLLLYGGAVTVVVGLVTITPATATGEGGLLPGRLGWALFKRA